MPVSRSLATFGISRWGLVPVEAFSFSPEFRSLCERNACGRYGTCWTCPPGAGAWKTLAARVRGFVSGLVLQTVWPVEDAFDVEGMLASGRKHNAVVRRVYFEIRRRIPGASCMVLSAGACDLCERCTYPDSPCRRPEETFLPVEACGVDAASLAEKAGIPYAGGAGTVSYLAVVLGDAVASKVFEEDVFFV